MPILASVTPHAEYYDRLAHSFRHIATQKRSGDRRPNADANRCVAYLIVFHDRFRGGAVQLDACIKGAAKP